MKSVCQMCNNKDEKKGKGMSKIKVGIISKEVNKIKRPYEFGNSKFTAN